MLDQVIILPSASSRLTVKTGKRDKIDNLVWILRRNPLIFNLRVVIHNDSHFLQDVLDLRRSLHNLAIFFCNGINFTADVQEQVGVTIRECIAVSLANRHELIRFEEVLFKQKILLPENFGEGLGSHRILKFNHIIKFDKSTKLMKPNPRSPYII